MERYPRNLLPKFISSLIKMGKISKKRKKRKRGKKKKKKDGW